MQKLHAAGFTSIEVEPTRIYKVEEARDFLVGAGLDPEVAPLVENKFLSAFIRAAKPAGAPCDCPPGCVDLPCCN